MITLTLVRHGESTDNLRNVWAGWKDAPLSNHGLNQAKAAGQYFSAVKIHTIIASPLKRAFSTAQQIQKHQPESSKLPLISSPLIREQHFGEAEGHKWTIATMPPPPTPTSPPQSGPGAPKNLTGRLGIIDPKTHEKSYPVQIGREAKFPAGENLDDVALRTGEAFGTLVMPIVRASRGKKCGEVNVFAVSHGIAISETIGAIFARCVGGEHVDPDTWKGLKNTAWTRLVIGMEGETLDYDAAAMKEPPSESADSMMEDSGARMALQVEGMNPPPTDGEGQTKKEIKARVVAVNQHAHLEGIVRQKGGIGSMPHDENQKAITDFFGGGGSKQEKPAAAVPQTQPVTGAGANETSATEEDVNME